MPYKITSVSTKPTLSTPNFADWLDSVPVSTLANFPDAAGKTPDQVIEESVAELDNPADGFISQGETYDESGLVRTWESVWESKESWISAVAKNSFSNGNVETAGSFLRQLYFSENNITVENFEANI